MRVHDARQLPSDRSANQADIARRALVELSPLVTKLQCPVRQVSARQLGPDHSSLALVGAHPRSDQGVGGLQSDARSHSPASITWAYRYAADSTDNFMTHRY